MCRYIAIAQSFFPGKSDAISGRFSQALGKEFSIEGASANPSIQDPCTDLIGRNADEQNPRRPYQRL